MKAVLLAPIPPPVGGIAKWAINMRGSHLKKDWEIDIIKTNDEKKEIYKQIGKHDYFYEMKRCVTIWRNLRKKLVEEDTKVIHANIPANVCSMLRECVCAAITRLYKKKFVVHFHCTLTQKVKSKRTLLVLKLLCKISGNVIVLNEQSEEYIKRNTKANVFLVPNFVDDSIILQENKPISTKAKRFLYVGGIIDSKGCTVIINIASHFPDLQFRLVGFVSDEYKNVKLPSNVIFTGVKNGEDLENEFKEADCFLFLSFMDSEGFSVALTEAMAYGLPCIATDWAANRDMLEEEGGIIVPIKSEKKVIESIERMVYDTEFRENASKFNVKKVKSTYSQSTVANMFVDIYEKVISG